MVKLENRLEILQQEGSKVRISIESEYDDSLLDSSGTVYKDHDKIKEELKEYYRLQLKISVEKANTLMKELNKKVFL